MSDKHQFLASLLECPICLNAFDDPRMLTCLHTLCHKCLDQYMKQSGQNGEFLCPVCRLSLQIPAKGAEGFPKNFFMNNCLAAYADIVKDVKTDGKTDGKNTGDKKSKSESIICAGSEDGDECTKPEQFCKDCRDYLCRMCSKAHRRLNVTRDHNLVPIEELTEEMVTEAMNKPEVPKCQKHPDKTLEVYCDECERAVCIICCQTTHRSHVIREISDVDDDVKSELEKAIASLQSMIDDTNQQSASVNKLQQSVQSNSSSAIATCDGLFDKMRQLLNQEATQVKDKISKVNDDGAAQAYVQNKNLKLHLQLLDGLRSFVHDLLHKGSVFNRLASLPDLRSRLQDLQSPSQSSAQFAPEINVPSASALIVDSVGGFVLEEEVAFPDGAAGGMKITQNCRVIPDKADVNIQTETKQSDQGVQAACEQTEQSVQAQCVQSDQGVQAVCKQAEQSVQAECVQVHQEVQTLPVMCVLPKLTVFTYDNTPRPRKESWFRLISQGSLCRPVFDAARSLPSFVTCDVPDTSGEGQLRPVSRDQPQVDVIGCAGSDINSLTTAFNLNNYNTANRNLVLVHKSSDGSLERTLTSLGDNKRLFRHIVQWQEGDEKSSTEAAAVKNLAEYFLSVVLLNPEN